MIRIFCSRTSGMKELIVSCFSSGPVILTECAAVFPSLSLCPPFSISISFPFLSFHFFLPFPPCSTLFLLLHPFSYTSLSLSLYIWVWGRGTDKKREGANDVSLSLNGFRCVPFLQGAVIGIDDEDDSTFTITVDQKTFHFQGEVSIL